MPDLIPARLDRLLFELMRDYPGPGGAVAVLREGRVVLRHAWGFANAERRIPFTPGTLFRFCSITKQFTCGLVLDAFKDPTSRDGAVSSRLPNLAEPAPGILHLCHNQSGLRDYWALAMLQGAAVESAFGDPEASALVRQARSLHFKPGTRYSYVNQNFRLLSDILEAETGRGFAELLRTRIFAPAGMETAFLAADTRAMPDGTEGYEGTPERGFRAAVNNIIWTGDAGLGASLDDMIAWERHIDATRDDPDALPTRLSVPVMFKDGSPAAYGFGLRRSIEFGRVAIGHGGALRGWRSQRLYVPGERLSIVVMFNHLSDAHSAAIDLLGGILGETSRTPALQTAPNWLGAYVEPETGLSVRIEAADEGQVRLRYGHSAEILALDPDGAASDDAAIQLRALSDGLWMVRRDENQRSRLQRIDGEASLDVTGRYRCEEIDADLVVVNAGGLLHGAFTGPLGQGRMERLSPIGPDVWLLPCPRALDHTPPGDWTLAFHRDASGDVAGLKLGCWLARGLAYRRLG
ncbi:D-stereospecific aminopeptidase Serine peptidase. MEROPS family S12 [Arboricoccus pini]|uniref:D-stereospecific aminopeptidase Serine peptidase. MEROPS family S12 n=1 Tax=Arboricoccus pini TaxID=1963835 RepID=A0A212RIT0_9PROT|nr:D-aminopeptidase [Arboricoccus pini]SNB72351.1 D-stereospecific aminopeptidase Serine peptidase. MEROPS family S12 [Arboricoccus pini]